MKVIVNIQLCKVFCINFYSHCIYRLCKVSCWFYKTMRGGGAEEGTVPVILLLPTVSQNMHGDNVHITYPGL